MQKLRSRLTYANVIATLALFIALGGASYAAIKLPKNSVGSRQLKKNSVTAAKIKKGAITGAKVNLATLGTVPSAASANHATSADKASALSNPEAVHFIGVPGEPKFENGFSDASDAPVGFYKDHECNVHLVGQMEGPGGVAFTLPPGFRPFQPAWGAVLVGGPGVGQLTFSVDGRVAASTLGGPAVYFGLDSVSFRVAGC